MNLPTWPSRVRGLAWLLAATVCLSGSGFAQEGDADEPDLLARFGAKKSPAQPKFSATLTPAEAGPGDEVTLAISVELPKGYYIYSTTGDFSGRTKIKLQTDGLDAVDDEFVPNRDPKVSFDPGLKAEVAKFFDRVTWSRKFRMQAEAKSASISGELTGQYCGGPDAETPACIPIRPAYQFVVRTGRASAALNYADKFQPTRKIKGVEQPTPIAYEASLSPTDAKPGEKVTLTVTAKLNEGWHTFSLTQKDQGGTPTVFESLTLHGLKPADEGFQADHPFEVEDHDGNKLEIHHGKVTWRRDFEVLPDVPPGRYGVAFKINAQYCDPRTCNRVKAEFTLGDVSGIPAAAPVAEAPVPPADIGKRPQEKGLVPFILLCLGGGFLALLTPCSFPMVPITVSFFLKQSETSHKRPWLLALVYCGSIVAAFTILGVGISAVFGATKLNELANIPWLNVIIGTVFVLFALNMLGVFDIHMPGWLLTMMASKESAGSYLGAVFMALTFTLTSFTCTFAIAGSLLVGAAQGEVYWPVIGMLAFGTAFAAPFFVLAMLPGLLKQLPKSGGWMNSVKVVMGLLELGAAVKFFSIADPGQVLFDHVTVMMIWFVLSLVTAAYLFNWFRLPHDTQTQQISPWRMLLGTGCFVLAGMLVTGVALPGRGGVAVRQILAFAPARFEVGDGPLGPSLMHHGLEFALYLDKAIPVAEKENRPLLLDFTGVNCANCRDMELKMAQAAWKERIAKFVGVQLYVDVPQIPGIADPAAAKQLLEENIKLQDKLVQDTSMPAYAVVTPDGKTVLATYIGAEPANQAGTFVQFLDEGWKRWEARNGKAAPAVGNALGRNEQALR